MLRLGAIGAVVLAVLAVSCGVAHAQYTIGAEQVVVSHSTLTANNLASWPDGIMGVVANADGSYTFWAAAGSNVPSGAVIVRSVGTLANPFATSVQTVAMHWVGCDYYAGGQVFKDPSSAMLLMFTHCEHWDNGFAPPKHLFSSTVRLATSWDSGYTWQDLGDIITPYCGVSCVEAAWTQGYIHPNSSMLSAVIQVGANFQLYYTERLGTAPTDAISGAVAVQSDVFAAARNNQVSGWLKYNGPGQWQPGIGGSAALLNGPHTICPITGIGTFTVAFSAVRNKYLLIGTDWGNPTPVCIMESSDGIAWADAQVVPNSNYTAVYHTLYPPSDSTFGTFALYYLTYSAAGNDQAMSGRILTPCTGLHC